jgi:hypothetical protein
MMPMLYAIYTGMGNTLRLVKFYNTREYAEQELPKFPLSVEQKITSEIREITFAEALNLLATTSSRLLGGML